MCLLTKQTEAFIAKEDIIVYKLLLKRDNKYFTFFQGYPVKLNSLLIPAPIEGDIIINDNRYYTIEGGMIHSYAYDEFKRAAQKMLDRLIYYRTVYSNVTNSVLVKAIIKKGTKFYIDTSRFEIASESLYITDEIYGPTDVFKQTNLSEYVN